MLIVPDPIKAEDIAVAVSLDDRSPLESKDKSKSKLHSLNLSNPETSTVGNLELAFEIAIAFLDKIRQQDEQFTLSLIGEESQFCRFNQARVRQTGQILDASLHLTWLTGARKSYREFPLSGDWDYDRSLILNTVAQLRKDLKQLPDNPYLVFPNGDRRSHAVHQEKLLAPEQVINQVLSEVKNLDFVGIYSAGWSVRAYADSVGQYHWFMSESFSLDYSLFNTSGQAVKGIYAGRLWDQRDYLKNLDRARVQLRRLDRPSKKLDRGKYRTYLAPAAVAELIPMMSWGGVSESDLQQGGSWLLAMRKGDRRLSEKLNLIENFGRGTVPRFNELGEISPEQLTIFDRGQLKNTLISSRTAKEYGLVSNGANQIEGLRAPEILPGHLPSSEILSALDTGVYVSNLHYLNWSDRPQGRITGMTRYACFWVEQGELVAPIEHMRFDDSLYNFWGKNLMDLTDTQECIPNVDSYDRRSIETRWIPGMLIEDFTYTL